MSLALLFSPQGAQAVGMGRDLAAASSAARAAFEQADESLGWSVSTLAWEGPEDRLNDTRQTQPCLVATSVACLAALREALAARGEELRVTRVAGHSVGEYTALIAAGVLSVPDALRLVARRGELMADASIDGGMAAVIGLGRQDVQDVVEAGGEPGSLVVANDNAPGHVVVSGTHAALERVQPALVAAGARRVIGLNVSGPFHSPLMEGVGHDLAAAFDQATWHDADPPVVSNVTATPVRDAAEIRSLLARQVSSPVEWVRSVQAMVADGVDTFVECGPGAMLSGMVKRIADGVRTLQVADPASLAATLEALAGARAGATV
jgi:[acyl-carrier-protein] S-malonyltransferase